MKADFLEIKLGNQPNPPAPPTFAIYDVILTEIKGKSKRNQEISYAKIARCRPLGHTPTVNAAKSAPVPVVVAVLRSFCYVLTMLSTLRQEMGASEGNCMN